MNKGLLSRIVFFLRLAIVFFLCSIILNMSRVKHGGSGVSSILLCEELDSFNDPFSDTFSHPGGEIKYTLTPLCAITDSKKIELIMSEMSANHASDTDGVPFIGILCYLVFFDSSSNIVDAVHIVNWKASIISNNVVQDGDTLVLSNALASRHFKSQTIARIAYDTLLEKYPSKVKKMDDLYQSNYQRTTEEILMNGIEDEL